MSKLEQAVSSCDGTIALFDEDFDCPEQQDNDPSVKEIFLRKEIVSLLRSSVVAESACGDDIADQVYDLLQKDSFFQESTITREDIQTVGFMEKSRNTLELLQSTASVQDSMFRVSLSCIMLSLGFERCVISNPSKKM